MGGSPSIAVSLALRGGRCPVGALTAVVCALRRLRCGARGSVAPRNSRRYAALHSAQTAAASMWEVRAARTDTPPCAPRHRRDRARRAPPTTNRMFVSDWLHTTIASAMPPLLPCGSGCASGAPSSAGVRVGAPWRASSSDSPQLFERSAQREESSAVRPNTEQRRAVAKGDRSSEALSATCPQARLCCKAQETKTC